MNKKSSKKGLKNFTIKQLVALIIGILIVATSLIFLVLGLIEEYANIPNSILTTPDSSMKSIFGGVGFTWFGVIFTVVGSVIIAFSLSLASKLEEREQEKEARRKQRLAALNQSSSNESTLTVNLNKENK